MLKPLFRGQLDEICPNVFQTFQYRLSGLSAYYQVSRPVILGEQIILHVSRDISPCSNLHSGASWMRYALMGSKRSNTTCLV
jgi:hypothetical protein